MAKAKADIANDSVQSYSLALDIFITKLYNCRHLEPSVDSQDGVRHPDKGTDKTILLISRHYWRSPDGLAALPDSPLQRTGDGLAGRN